MSRPRLRRPFARFVLMPRRTCAAGKCYHRARTRSTGAAPDASAVLGLEQGAAKTVERLRVERMLFGKHPRRERFWIVARQDPDPLVADDRAAVELLGHDMDRAAGIFVACEQGPPVRVQALVLRQQRGVDV